MVITTLEKIYLYICLSIISAGCAFLGYWYFYPVNVIKIENAEEIKLDKKVYKPGDRITYTLTYCKYKDVPGTIQRALVNSIRINYTAYYNNLPAGCATIRNSELQIPEFADGGVYHIETTIDYKVNPIRHIYTHWSSQKFIVEESTIQEQVDKSIEDIKDLNSK